MKEKEKQITIFICENKDVSREIVSKYLKIGEVTYAEFLPAEKRKDIVDFLKTIEEPFIKTITPLNMETEKLETCQCKDCERELICQHGEDKEHEESICSECCK